ncbi:ABC transporter permease [Sphingobacterium paludis]|uniref:MacB-like protein n=1 Tax=Sphingobacterium paludis TaxID=1476465 RepID=A0A4R7D5U9_9SPHI|nr:ABC transporter permease [Sphingobacterium paludis]TDS15947.1 MacB-like protein [Sphingobacterium paludis]
MNFNFLIFLKIAWRNIRRNKAHSILNIAGLVGSMVFVLLIAAYIWQAYQVNSNVRHKQQQYMLQSKYKQPGIGMELTTVGALPKMLKEQYPSLVADYYRLDGLTCIVSNGTAVYEENVSLGDPSLLKMFGFQLLAGDAHTALSSPTNVVIKEEVALKYFGKTDVIGRQLSLRNFAGDIQNFQITAVVKSVGQNSVMELMPSMQTGIFLPISSEKYFGRDIDSWNNLWIVGFLELQKGISPDQLTIPIQNLLKQHANEQVFTNLQPDLKPLTTYYLDDNKGAVRKFIAILGYIALFLILMATINFINLSISQSFNRLKEIGVRKIMGSSKSRLILQFMTEYCVIVTIAALLALAVYPLLLPVFSAVMMKHLPALTELPLSFYISFASGTLALGFAAGIYPAVKLSTTAVTNAVKSQLSDLGGKSMIRRTLLFLQFAVALIVLISAVIITQQVDVFIAGNLGYNKNYLLTAQVPRDWTEKGLNKMELVQQELKQLPQVEEVSLSYGVPSSFSDGVQIIRNPGNSKQTDALLITSDSFYAATYQIPVLAGQFFGAPGDPSMASKLVINRKAALDLGYAYPEDAIGQRISLFDDRFSGTVAGVTENFYANSMHAASPAVVWFPVKASSQYRFLSIRLKAGSLSAAVAAIEHTWHKLLPNAPFNYTFMDDTLQKIYSSEVQLKRAAQTATGISIIIVVLGVVGLTSLSINLRLKEVGIRKVLGANMRNIIMLFSREFYILFFVALCISCPISYYLMDRWLMNYVLKTPLDLKMFLLPVAALSMVLFLFITIVVIRANRTNPIKNLRDE